MRVLNRPYASLRICLIALSAPTFMMEISAPETGLPWLSRSAPVTVPRLALLALTLGACRQSDAHNKVRSTPKVLALRSEEHRIATAGRNDAARATYRNS